MEVMLREEVEKILILRDPSVSNNAKIKEGEWEGIRSLINEQFGSNLLRKQVSKKYGDMKYATKAKVTTAVEFGSIEDGKRVASTWGECRKHGRGQWVANLCIPQNKIYINFCRRYHYRYFSYHCKFQMN